MSNVSEKRWARSTYRPPRAYLSTRDGLAVAGLTILFLTLAPPMAVILWRLALLPWP